MAPHDADHDRPRLPVHARRADRRPRVRPLPGRGGLRRQGAALLDRLRPRALAPPAAPDSTEFVVCALPLGGYVRMLDEREGAGARPTSATAPSTASRSGSARRSSPPARSPTCCSRSLLYAARHWIGVDEPKAVLGPPAGGQRRRARRPARRRLGRARSSSDGNDWHDMRSLTDLRWQVTQAVLHGDDLELLRERHATAAASAASRSTLDVARRARGRRQADAARSASAARAASRCSARSSRAGPAPRRACAPATACSRSTAVAIVDASQVARARSARSGKTAPRCRCSWRIERGGQRARARGHAGGRRSTAASAVGRLEVFPGSRPRWCRCATAPIDGLGDARDADLADVGADA